MGQSYKNTSSGGAGVGDSGAKYSPIREYSDPKPPAGASNSYEKIRSKIDASDSRALSNKHYSREKMANK